MGLKWSKIAYPLRTGHRVQIVYVHGDDLRPKKENQFVQEKVRVVTAVLPLKISLPKKS